METSPQGGNGHRWHMPTTEPPRRVISLVPSLTKSLLDLGFGETLVGISDYFPDPEGAASRLPRIGGPKDPRAGDILALKPDLVIANQEENPKELVEILERLGIPVWVTFPKTVLESIDLLWDMVRIFQDDDAADKIRTIEITLEWELASLEDAIPKKYFCPIWQEEYSDQLRWYMTFNQDTYPANLLGLLGGTNAFGGRNRRYPLEADLGLAAQEDPGSRDIRYPRVTQEEVIAAEPEIILLPSEPFSYAQEHIDQFSRIFAETPAAKNGKILLIDGSLISWYGTHLALSITELPQLFA